MNRSVSQSVLPTDSKLTLISHALCPYVQRAAIVLAEKGVAFQRVDIDLAHKPDWFLNISPLGKTPVLLVDSQAIFESAVICEYLEETTDHKLHPPHPLLRAQHRGWMEFGSAVLNAIAGFYAASSDDLLAIKVADIRSKIQQLEGVLTTGPFFHGEAFSLVDAVFGPVFRYFDVLDTIEDFGFFADAPKVCAWRSALAKRPSVRHAVRSDYPDLLRTFLLTRQSALSARMTLALA